MHEIIENGSGQDPRYIKRLFQQSRNSPRGWVLNYFIVKHAIQDTNVT